MRKITVAIVLVAAVLAAGCGDSTGGGASSSAVITDSGMVSSQSGSGPASSTITFEGSQASSGAPKEMGTIQKELNKIEEASEEFRKKDWGSMDQQTMNKTASEWYKLWDDELNSLWDRLMEKINPARKENTLTLQRAWIKEKEEKVKKAGQEAEGGTLQPYLEAGEAMRQTRARCYYIGSLLVESIGGEPYEIPEDAMKILTEK